MSNKNVKNLENEFFVKKIINQYNENDRNSKWYNHKPLKGWYNMNYPNKYKSNLLIFKEDNSTKIKRNYDSNFQKDGEEINLKKIYTINEYNKIINTNKKKTGKNYNDLWIKNEYTIGSTNLEYKLSLNEKNNKNCKIYSIYGPISAGIHVRTIKDSYYEFKELVWNKNIKLKKNIKLAYKNELERHCQNYGTEIISDQSMIPLLNDRLLYLDLKNYNFLNLNIISKIGFHSPNIIYLSLENLNINNEILFDIVHNLKKLDILNINNCININELFFNQLKENKINLKGLHCKNNKYITNEILWDLKLELLKELDISSCYKIDNLFFEKISEYKVLNLEYFKIKNNKNNINFDFLNLIFEKCKESMKYVNMSNCIFDSEKKNIGNLVKCKKLISLNLKGNNCINYSNCFSFIEENLYNLKSSNLSNMENINEGCINKAIISYPNIEILKINNNVNFTNNNFFFILNNCKKIKILSILDCKNLNKIEDIEDYPFYIFTTKTEPYKILEIPLPVIGHKRPNPKKKKK